MSRRPLSRPTMRRGRKLAMLALSAATLVLLGAGRSRAQSDAPDPSMLLNLDLFSKPIGGAGPVQDGEDGDSMVEQIRALRAMGYLGNDADGPPGPPPDGDDPVVRFAPEDDPEREQ